MLNLPGLDIDIDAEIERYRQYATKIRPFVIDSVDWLTSKFEFINKLIIKYILKYSECTRNEAKLNILVEGANATMLDLDHGTYPFAMGFKCLIH